MLKRSMIVALLLLSGLLAINAEVSLNEPFQSSSFFRLVHTPCVTLYTREGRIGCGTYTDEDTSPGRLIAFDDFVSGSCEQENGVILMTPDDYTTDNVASVADCGGVLVVNSTTSSTSSSSATSISPDAMDINGAETPLNGQLSYGGSYDWNINGNGLLYENYYGMPTVFVNDADVSSYLLQEAKNEESLKGTIVAEFNYYMGGNGDGPYVNEDSEADDDDGTNVEYNSISCLQWQNANDGYRQPKCLPLGGNTVWATSGGTSSDASGRGITLLTTSIDATSQFHDASLGASTAASNILVTLLASKLLGSLSEDVLQGLPNQIVVAMFQGESFGYLGSRMLFEDLLNFSCDLQVSADDLDDAKKLYESNQDACLSPMRPSLAFENLGGVTNVVAVDQMLTSTFSDAAAAGFYVHSGIDVSNGDDDGNENFITNAIVGLDLNDDFPIAESAVQNANDDAGEVIIPPSALHSLLSLGSTAGGVVLTGYDEAFTKSSPNAYNSQFDALVNLDALNINEVIAAVRLVARSAIAASYAGDGQTDSDTAAQNALDLLPDNDDAISNDDILDLANCLYIDGSCALFKKYSTQLRANEKVRTGMDIGTHAPLASSPYNKPSYYTNVYNEYNGQPFVQLGKKGYAMGRVSFEAQDEEDDEQPSPVELDADTEQFGMATTDALLWHPSLLEVSISSLLNTYLGTIDSTVTCSTTQNCLDSDSNLCSTNSKDTPVCGGEGICVCQRSHFHPAHDLGMLPEINQQPGYWTLNNNYQSTPLYTESNWSSNVGVKVYRMAGSTIGNWMVVFGLSVSSVSVYGTLRLKTFLSKEKLY